MQGRPGMATEFVVLPTNCAHAESLPELLGKSDKDALGAAYET